MSVIIRDGLESDLEGCLALDHGYETEYVWQMAMRDEGGAYSGWEISFRTERLPRPIEEVYPADEQRLRAALGSNHGLLVAVNRADEAILAYLTISSVPAHRIAQIHDLVVSRPYRGGGIGRRLVGVAQRWARERALVRLTAEVSTHNVPAMQFCTQAGFTFCGFNDHYLINKDIAVFFTQPVR